MWSCFRARTSRLRQRRVVDLDRGDRRPFVVAVREVVLGAVAGQVLEEADRGITVRRMFGDAAAGQVHLGAGRGLVREHHRHLRDHFLVLGLLRGDQPCPVVAVRDGDLALAAGDRADLVGIAALRRAGLVGDDALQDLARLRFTVALQQRREQREVVRMAARARADLALVLRVGELLVGVDVLGLDLVLVVEDHAGTGREAIPGAVGGTVGLRDPLVENLGLDRLEETFLLSLPQPGRVDEQHDVGRTLGAFVAHPLEQGLVTELDPVDLDAGGLREVRVQRLVGLVVTGRVQVQDLVLRQGGGRTQSEAGRDHRCGQRPRQQGTAAGAAGNPDPMVLFAGRSGTGEDVDACLGHAWPSGSRLSGRRSNRRGRAGAVERGGRRSERAGRLRVVRCAAGQARAQGGIVMRLTLSPAGNRRHAGAMPSGSDVLARAFAPTRRRSSAIIFRGRSDGIAREETQCLH